MCVKGACVCALGLVDDGSCDKGERILRNIFVRKWIKIGAYFCPLHARLIDSIMSSHVVLGTLTRAVNIFVREEAHHKFLTMQWIQILYEKTLISYFSKSYGKKDSQNAWVHVG